MQGGFVQEARLFFLRVPRGWLGGVGHCSLFMKIRVQNIEDLRLRPDHSLTVATLDVPYYDFIAFDSSLPRPSPKPHHEKLQLRVRLTRADGTFIEPVAFIVLISGVNPPAKITLDDVKSDDIPIGTDVTLLGYEILPLANDHNA